MNLPPMAELTAETSICNTDQNNDPTILNLNDLILSGDATGTWIDLDASGATGTLPNLDFNGVTAGDYTFEYTTAAAQAPCENVAYTVTVSALDCSCPDVSISGAEPFCNDAAILDLATITTTTEAGTWTIANAPTNSTATITDNTFNGFDALGELNTSALTIGNYEFSYQVSSNGICANDEVLVAVNLNETPIADAGETSVLTCDEPTAMIGGDSSVGANIAYLWSGTVEDSIAAMTTTNLPGTYTITVTDTESGCGVELFSIHWMGAN
ncbi:MAG: hypothetical protein ACPGVB_15495 [Chitinophagales bacterium]